MRIQLHNHAVAQGIPSTFLLAGPTDQTNRLRFSLFTRSRPALPLLARAFTLVEMLLVLVILATLAAIVYPKVMGRSKQAQTTAAQQQVANFKIALDAFEVDNQHYPRGRNGLLDLVQQPRDCPNWHGPYLDNLPKDPWHNDYVYECPGRHNPASYDIYSQGPPNEQSPIGNWQVQTR